MISNKTLLTIYLTFWFVAMWGGVGERVEASTIDWYAPYYMLLVIGIPAILGYLIGKNNER